VQPGDVIDGKYRVEAQLGEGGMGTVIAATHLHLENTVAIKVLKLEATKHKEAALRFKREAKAASRLRSEHVVKVSDVGQMPNGAAYMVMEMLYGEDVATQLKRGPLPIATAVDYIIQACEGLAEAHGLGMIHRDVKPANLFVTRRPNGAPLVKLVDFGIATAGYGEVDHKLTTTQSVMGSPTYMSPEQLRAARDVDARSDIWSLGVTLYEMLCARQPFEGPTLTALTLKIVGDAHPRIPGAPPELHMVLDRCLAKDREARFANVGELAQALAPFLDHGELAASMVVGALSQGVAPTLHGVEPSSSGFNAVRSAPPSTQIPVSSYLGHHGSTTNMGAGQTASRLDLKRGRGVWIGVGAAMLVASVAIALIVRSSTSSGTPAANASVPPAPEPVKQPAPPPPPAPAPPKPTAEPIIDTQKIVEQQMDKVPAAPASKPAKKPSTRVTTKKNSGSGSTSPQDPYKQKEPPKEPQKQPCLPSDPQCGL
jgi:eukaryotic-like serine/threonine-protein kinase